MQTLTMKCKPPKKCNMWKKNVYVLKKYVHIPIIKNQLFSTSNSTPQIELAMLKRRYISTQIKITTKQNQNKLNNAIEVYQGQPTQNQKISNLRIRLTNKHVST